jgi:TP901 family phage tail tape measure protein
MGGGALGGIATAGAAAAAAMVGVGVESVKAAGDFQQSMSLLVTSAGESQKNIQMVSDGILKMSVDTGTSTKQLGAGMYYIESAGYHAADALKVLGVAAMGAKTENADLDTVAKAVTGVMTDYHMKVGDASQAMNGLIATVQNGKTNLQDLSSSMGNVLPIASALHISFPQVAGAMDTMTNANMNARQASQNLAHVLLALSAPSGIATKSMKEVGLSAQGVKDALVHQGLPEALQMIEDHVGKKFPKDSAAYDIALKNILGGQVGFKLAAMLTGKSLQETEANIAKVTAAMKANGGAVMGWEIVQQNLNFQLDRAKAAFNVLLITIGQKLLPIVTPMIKWVADMMSGTGDLSGSVSKLGGAFSWLGGLFQEVWKQIFNDEPIGLLVEGFKYLTQVIGGVVWRTIKGFSDFLGQELTKNFGSPAKAAGALAGVVGDIGVAFDNVANAIKRAQPFLDMLGHVALGGIAALVTGVHNLVVFLSGLGPVVQQVGGFLKTLFLPVLDQLKQAIAQVTPYWKQFVDSIGPALPTLKFIGEVIGVVIVGALILAAYTLAGFLRAVILVAEGIAIAFSVSATSIMNALALMKKGWDMLVAAWNGAPAFFTNLWNSIKQAFSSAWNWVVTQATGAWRAVQNAWGATGKWFQDIGATIMHALGSAWDWIKIAAANTWNAIKTAAATAWSVIVGTVTDPIHAIADSFKWLYDHNYYFQDLVDAIKKAFDSVLKWSQQQWTAFSSWITGIWQGMTKSADDQGKQTSDAITQHTNEATQAVQNGWTQASNWLDDQWKSITNHAQSAWDGFSKQVESITNSCIKTIEQVWTQATNWITNEWNTISRNVVNAATSMWRQVSQIFSSAWSTYIVQPLTGLMTNITNWANNLIKSFQTWAANAMKGFGQSITQNLASVTTPITNVGAEIAKLLGFHSPPPAGPLAQSHTWMPNMMTMFGQGVANNTTKVTTPVNTMALQVGLSMNNLNNNVNANSRLINMNLATIGTTAQRTNQQTGQSLNQMTASAQNAANGVSASTNQINSSIQTVNTNIQSINQVAPQAFQSISQSSQQAATDVGKSSDDISKSAQTITTSAQSINQIAPPAFQNVSRSSQQAAQDVAKSGNDMKSSAKDTANGVKTYMVTVGGSASDAADKFKTASNDMQHAARDTDKMVQDIFKGDILRALDDFQKQLTEKGAAIVAQAQGIASQVAALLGHSKPSLGPLKDDDTWGKHFVENIVGGMKDGMPGLTSMTNTLASTLAGGLASPLAGKLAVSGGLASPTIQSSQPMIIYNTIDGKVISKIVTNYQAGELRAQGGLRR